MCLIRLCGNGWPREPHASRKEAAAIPSPNKNGGQTLISNKGGAELLPPVTSDYLAIRQSRKRKLAKHSGIPLPFDATMGSLGGECVWPGGMDVPKRAGGQQPGGTRRAHAGLLPTLQGTSRASRCLPLLSGSTSSRRTGGLATTLTRKLGDGVVITRTTQTRSGFAARAVLQVDGPSLVIGKPASQPARAHCMCYSQGQVDVVVVVNHSPSYVLLQTISCYHPVP